MIFMQFLKNLDELLYEVMSWLLFYPITLWRSVRHPRRMMTYADAELGADLREQYTDVISPPTFLVLTLILSHAVELAVVGNDPIVASRHGLSGLVNDDTNLLMLRIVAYAIFPIVLSAWLVRRQGRSIERETVKLPFYSQCYATAPLALVFSTAATISRVAAPWALTTAGGLVVVGAVWFIALQTSWFRRELGVSTGRALADAITAYGTALVLLLALSLLFV